MIRILAGAAILIGLAGCAPDLTALAADHNALCVDFTTPWGATRISRNHGCEPGAALSALPPP